MSYAEDQADFMKASRQSVDFLNIRQAELYRRLVEEETQETLDAMKELDHALRTPGIRDYTTIVSQVADGCIDTIYVCLGLLHSLGVDPDVAWDEVHASNMTKIDPATGEVLKDPNTGKVLKPKDFRPPDMLKVVQESWGIYI